MCLNTRKSLKGYYPLFPSHLLFDRVREPADRLGDGILVGAGEAEPEAAVVMVVEVEELAGEVDDLVFYSCTEESVLIDGRGSGDPDIEAAVGGSPGYPLGHVGFEGAHQGVATAPVALLDLLDVSIEPVVAVEFGDDLLVERGRAHFEHGPADVPDADERLGDDRPSDAESRRDELGEAPEVDDRVGGVVSLHHGLVVLLIVEELAVGVVLRDEAVVLLCDRGEFAAPLRGEHDARRIVVVGHEVDHLWPDALALQACEGVAEDIGPDAVLINGNLDKVEPGVLDGIERSHECGGFDDHGVAGTHDHAGDHVHRRLGSGGHDHPVGADVLRAPLRHAVYHRLAAAARPLEGRIREDDLGVAGDEGLHDRGDLLGRVRGGIGNPRSEREDPRLAREEENLGDIGFPEPLGPGGVSKVRHGSILSEKSFKVSQLHKSRSDPTGSFQVPPSIRGDYRGDFRKSLSHLIPLSFGHPPC